MRIHLAALVLVLACGEPNVLPPPDASGDPVDPADFPLCADLGCTPDLQADRLCALVGVCECYLGPPKTTDPVLCQP